MFQGDVMGCETLVQTFFYLFMCLFYESAVANMN